MFMLLALLAGSALQGDAAQTHAQKVADKNEVVCIYKSTTTGSVRKLCATRKEFEEQRADLQRSVRETQYRSYMNPR